MSSSVSTLFSRLRLDGWREMSRFSADLEDAQKQVFDSVGSEDKQKAILNRWLEKNQPCLFGRAVARLDAISYCILTESDLIQTDEWIRGKIQSARLDWTREGYKGRSSGFIIWIISSSIASAEPGFEMVEFARRLCSLYLETEIEVDRIYLDEIFLEKPGLDRTTWKWFAGVNYFCSQGDKRWWHDHRIPGGMALSVNSVGHLVKSAIIAKAMNSLGDVLGFQGDDYREVKWDSLGTALQVAMLTIDLAAITTSGKATELILQDKKNECPIVLPAKLAGKDCSRYRGYYHTDITLPSQYFRPDIERPVDLQAQVLDFTYLYDRSLSNPDFVDMGEGRVIRAIPDEHGDSWSVVARHLLTKSVLSEGEIVPMASAFRLQEALTQPSG